MPKEITIVKTVYSAQELHDAYPEAFEKAHEWFVDDGDKLGWSLVGISVILLCGLTDAAPFRWYLGSLALMCLGALMLIVSDTGRKVKRHA